MICVLQKNGRIVFEKNEDESARMLGRKKYIYTSKIGMSPNCRVEIQLCHSGILIEAATSSGVKHDSGMAVFDIHKPLGN